ncbi:MAG: carbonic anhydrase [Herminiimonas sp.]|nr:carbonic anhydrase [Herminiimonas sp.]
MDSINQGKRGFFRQICCGSIGFGALLASSTSHAAGTKRTTLTPEQALKLLKDGNENSLTDSPIRAVQGRDRRLEIARNQAPIAVLVSCADSRVPPELLFGRGLGELFIVRNAGNTVDTVALGSIEYAVAELGVPLIVVMGHERCGAVDAALAMVEKNINYPGSIGQMIEPIVPAVLRAQASMDKSKPVERDALLDMAVRENVMRVVRRLRNSEALLTEPLKQKKLMIVGARYDLDDGQVEFFTT